MASTKALSPRVPRELCAVVLAAGQGTRMRSDLAKVLHPLGGPPMVGHVLELCRRLGVKRTLVVIGHQAERVRDALATYPVEFIIQTEQRGTAHAVLQTEAALQGFQGDLLVINGDVPLMTDVLAETLLGTHRKTRAQATVITTKLGDPTGYGRVLRDRRGAFKGIVEEVEATAPQRRVKAGGRVASVLADDPREVLGINTRAELAEAYGILRLRVVNRLMEAGVTCLDPATTHVSALSRVGRDSVLYPQVQIEGYTEIGEGCTVHAGCRIRDSRLGNRVTVLDGCVILESEIADEAAIGPYAHLRPESRIRRKVKVGNFVEIKKSLIGEGSKVPHLTYVGDAIVGERVNIGAGTITCNYDGFAKHQTVIEDEVFIGSNASLVAPVRIGCGAMVAAGSTITQDVAPDALAFGRAQQVNKEGRAAVIRRARTKP